MENKKTSIFQAYKLYHSMGFVKEVLLAAIFSLAGSLFFGVFLLDKSEDEELRLVILFFNSFICYIASAINVFMTADTRISGLVYRTVKEPIEMYQKQHIASVLAGVSVILLNQLIVGIAFSCLWESIYMSLGLIFLKAVTNIFSVIKHDAFRSIVYVISGLPLFVYTICMKNLFEKKFFDFEFGIAQIVLVVLSAVIFFVSEKVVLKSIRKKWYKD